MADTIDSAEVVGTRPNIKHLVGISAGIPVIAADREMPSPNGGGAYRLHCIEGSRYGASVPGTWTTEYGEGTSCKSAIATPVDISIIDLGIYRWVGIKQPKSPITW